MEEDRIRELMELCRCRKIRRLGNNMMSTCPFEKNHKDGLDKNPSFSIEIAPQGENSRWHCFACGEAGRSINSLVWKLKGTIGDVDIREDRVEAYRPRIHVSSEWRPTKSRWYNVTKELHLDFTEYSGFYRIFPKYAFDRGVTKEQIEKWKLGVDRYNDRLFIPVFDKYQNFVGWSKRAQGDGTPKYLHCPGFKKEKFLYGENFIDKDYPIAFMVEGFFDAWALDRAGLKNVFANFGRGVGDLQLYTILKAGIKKVIIFPDNDKPGTNGVIPGLQIANEWVDGLRHINLHGILAPVIKGKKDVADWTTEEIHWILDSMGVKV